jgi:hypothetical protein
MTECRLAGDRISGKIGPRKPNYLGKSGPAHALREECFEVLRARIGRFVGMHSFCSGNSIIRFPVMNTALSWFNGGYRQVRRVAIAIIGFTVLAFGIVLLVTPGPAFVVIPIGLGILAIEFAWARRWLSKIKEKAQQGADYLQGRNGKKCDDTGEQTKSRPADSALMPTNTSLNDSA